MDKDDIKLALIKLCVLCKTGSTHIAIEDALDLTDDPIVDILAWCDDHDEDTESIPIEVLRQYLIAKGNSL